MHGNIQKKWKETSRGFTLVETLVAVTILLVVIIGPMTIAQKGIQNAFYAGDQTTAVYLAQEAIEAVQKLRDDVALAEYIQYNASGPHTGNTRSWYDSLLLAGICTNTGVNGGCDADFSSVNALGEPAFDRNCSSGQCVLKVDTDGTYSRRVYGYTAGWTDSIYTRRIRVDAMDARGGVPVTVTVSWTASIFGNTTRSVVLQTYVYDYYARYE